MPKKSYRRLKNPLANAIGLALLVNVLPANATPSFVITDLNTLGGTYSSGNAINAAGQVVGESNLTPDIVHAFLWENGGMKDLGTLGLGFFGFSSAKAINDNGQIVGQTSTTTNAIQAFSWQNGTMTDIGPVFASGSLASGVNNAGQIVGSVLLGTSFPINQASLWANSASSPVILQSPESTTANGINNAGLAVGTANSGENVQAYVDNTIIALFNPIPLGFLPNGSSSTGLAVNDKGQVVGYADTPVGTNTANHAVLWQSNLAIQDIGTLGGSNSQANAINGNGQVVGLSDTPTSGPHAFLWNNGVMVDLNTIISNNPQNLTLAAANGINALGQFTGTATTSTGDSHAYLATPTGTLNWTAGSGTWDNSSNWELGFVPSQYLDAVIAPSTANISVSGPAAATTVNSLSVGGGAGVATLSLNVGAPLTVNTNVSLLKGGTLNLTGSGLLNNSTVLVVNGGNLDIQSNDASVSGVQMLAGSIVGTTGTLTSASDFVLQSGSVSAKLGGSVGLTKTAPDTIVLSGTNAYTGLTTIGEGTLSLAGNGSILQSSGVTDNGVFDISGVNQGASIKTLSGNGSVVLGNQTLTLTQANGLFSGSIVGTAGSLSLAGGAQTLSGTNSYTGATNINNGILSLAGGAAIADTGEVNISQTGTLDLLNNETIGSLSGAVGSQVTLNANTLTTGDANNTAFAGNMSGTGGLVKQGTGTFILTGANTFGGGTTVSAGALQGDTTSLQGNIADNAAVVFDQATTGTYAGVLSGSGSLTKQGAGLLNLTGGNTYGGGTSVSAGTLQGNTTSLQGNIADNAAVVFDQATTGTYAGVLSGNGSLTKQGEGTLVLTGANIYSGGTTVSAGTLQGDTTSLQGNMVNNAAVVFDQAADGAYSSAMTGTGSLTKQGAGLLNLTGSNTYSGGTTVSSGILQGNTSSLQGNIADDAAVVFNQTTDGTYAGVLSGTGSLTKQGSGLLNLTGSNTYSGGTTVSAGTLQGNTTSLQGNIANNAVVVFDQATTGTYAGVLSGTGGLTKQGAGLLNLTGSNTYRSGTTVSSGTLQGNTTSLQGNIVNNAAVVFDQTTDGTYSGAMTGTGLLTKQGAGTLSLTGSNIFSGEFLLAGGALNAQGAFNNQATVVILSGSTLNNATGNNFSNAGTIFNQGTIVNAGTMSNQATLINQSGGILNNSINAVMTNLNELSNSGTINNTGTLNNQGNLVNQPGGILNLSDGSQFINSRIFTNLGTVNLQGIWTGSESSLALLNNQGTFNISGAGSHVIDGNVINQGTVNVHEASVTFTGNFVNNGAYISDPSTNQFTNLSVGTTGYIAASPQDTFIVNGDFANASTQNTQWNTSNANLVFASATPGQTAQHQMQLAGADKGAFASGAVNNFAWGSVTLSNGDRLTLSDGNATPGAALYARQVNLPGGVGELANISSSYNIYFDPTLPANQPLLGGQRFGSGGGLLLPWDFVPFAPGTVNAADLTPNEKNFASALDEACTIPSGALAARCVQLQGLSVPQQKQAIASLTPDQVPAQTDTAVKFSATRMDGPLARLAVIRAGGSAPFAMNINGMTIPLAGSKWSSLFGQKTKGGAASADAEPFRDSPLGVFIQARFNFGDMDSNTWSRGFNSQTRNVTAGADYRLTDQLVVGAAFNYTNVTTNYVNNSGRIDSDTYMGAIYGSYFLPHDFYVDWVANYGGNDYAFRRQYLYPGFVGQSNSSPSGNQYSFAVSSGKEFNWQEWLFNPYVRMEYLNLHINAYDENIGGGFGIATGGQTNHSFVTDLGLQISHAVSLPWGVVTPSMRVEWEHQYLNDNRAINMRLSEAAAGLGYFSVQTGNPDRDYVNLGGSVSAALPNGGGAFIRYETCLGQTYISEHIVEGGVRLTF